MRRNGHKVRIGKLSEFRPQVVNANKHTERGLRMLDDAMSEDGYVAPATAAADGEVIDGSARLERAFDRFDDSAIIVEHDGTRPIIAVRTDIPNAQTTEAKRIAVRANRIAQVDLEWNPDILKELAPEEIKGMFSDKELAEILYQTGVEPKDAEPQVDKAEELRQKWQTASGQLWEIGSHLLLCGDSGLAGDVFRLMGDKRATLAPVDPPYNVDFLYDGETVDDSKSEVEYEKFWRDWFVLAQKVSDRQIVTPGCYNLARWCRYFDPYHVAPWTKTNSMTNGKVARFWCWEPILFFSEKWARKRSNDVFDFPIGQQKEVANHPCPKPLPMWDDIIESYSDSGDLLYEAFAGSGTTLVAAENLNRKCYAMEISPAYCAVTLERMSKAFPSLKIERSDKAVAA